MSDTATVVGIIIAIGALILAVSSFRSHRLEFSQGWKMAAVWLIIIFGLLAVFQGLGI
jgi:hypothetical protein